MKFSLNKFIPKRTYNQSFDIIVDGVHHQIELDFCEFYKFLVRSYAYKELLLHLFYMFLVVVSAVILILKLCLEYGIIE